MSFGVGIWVLIPLAGILLGGVKEWMKFRLEQQQLGASAKELEGEVVALRQELAEQRTALVTRIENLETIVTSRPWQELKERGLTTPTEERLLAKMEPRSAGGWGAPSDEEKAAVLARLETE
jgi:hypothetical protein